MGGKKGTMPPLEMMIYAPDMFMLEIPEPCAIKTSLILLPIGNYLRSWGTFQTNGGEKKGNWAAGIGRGGLYSMF